MKKNLLIISLIIVIISGVTISMFWNIKNDIPTNYICQMNNQFNGTKIETNYEIETDKYFKIKNIYEKINYYYNNDKDYELFKQIIKSNNNLNFIFDDKKRIVYGEKKHNIGYKDNLYYYSFVDNLNDDFKCTPEVIRKKYEFVCSNDEENFNIITDEKMIVQDVKNNTDNQKLLDLQGNLQKIWINKYIEVLNDNYICKRK